MGTRGLKICKACRKSFEPQLTDDEIREIWFTEDQLAADEEHKLYSGHGHLVAPTQDLCEKCRIDPTVEVVRDMFGGPPQYRKRGKDDKPRRVPVRDGNIIAPLKAVNFDGPIKDWPVTASDGTELVIQGQIPPPQQVVDEMARIYKTLPEKDRKRIRAAVAKSKGVAPTPKKAKKKTLWQRLFPKKKKE